jgi:hypothetical protein
VLATWDIRSKNEFVRLLERASLSKDVRYEYKQQESFCSSLLAMRLFS